MRYDIRHVTTYRYEAPVSSARCVLKLSPRSGSDQQRLSHELMISPQPRTLSHRRDFFGNDVAVAVIEAPHVMLRVESRAAVSVERAPILFGLDGPDWIETRRAALASQSLQPHSPAHGIYPSPLVPLHPEVTDYARASFPAGRGVVAGARELMSRIRADFVYSPLSTDVTTPLADAFRARRGVCQDFAQIMIAGLRGLGVPAGYVSGYIRTIPPEGQARLEGADATHAWVNVWCGPELGWRGFDPTNAIEAGEDHIELALGRDFSDVSPLSGVFTGSGGHTLDVQVDVVPVP